MYSKDRNSYICRMAEPRFPLKPDKYYHIFNHTVGDEVFFKSERNYQFFLVNFKNYISPYADLLCYYLMKNHFHFVIRFHSLDTINIELLNREVTKEPIKDPEIISNLLSRQFSNYFNKYAKSFNLQEYRRGSLFKRSFMRIPINSNDYLLRLIRYIHLNPVKDNFVKLPSDWKFSSYNALVSSKKTMLIRSEVIDLFEIGRAHV